MISDEFQRKTTAQKALYRVQKALSVHATPQKENIAFIFTFCALFFLRWYQIFCAAMANFFSLFLFSFSSCHAIRSYCFRSCTISMQKGKKSRKSCQKFRMRTQNFVKFARNNKITTSAPFTGILQGRKISRRSSRIEWRLKNDFLRNFPIIFWFNLWLISIIFFEERKKFSLIIGEKVSNLLFHRLRVKGCYFKA